MDDIPLEEQATNAATYEHIEVVRNLINRAVVELLRRAEMHDQSKLGDIERPAFTRITPLLRASTYGSEEYKGFLVDLGPALTHHYECNRHHPEHFKNGIEGMNLIDVLEMLLDWKAATLRHDDADIMKSIEINRERFGLSDQLVAILRNTVRDLRLLKSDDVSTHAETYDR